MDPETVEAAWANCTEADLLRIMTACRRELQARDEEATATSKSQGAPPIAAAAGSITSPGVCATGTGTACPEGPADNEEALFAKTLGRLFPN